MVKNCMLEAGRVHQMIPGDVGWINPECVQGDHQNRLWLSIHAELVEEGDGRVCVERTAEGWALDLSRVSGRLARGLPVYGMRLATSVTGSVC